MKNIYRSLVADITDAPERRFIPYDRINLRDDSDDDNIVHFEGYASTFEDYLMYGGPAEGGWIERLGNMAFDKTLREKPDLHFLINHEGLPIARTKSGTMQLSVDSGGLKVIAQLDKRDPDVQGLAVKMERGDMDQMSFAFRVKAQKWEATDEFRDDPQALRTITEVSLHKGDVSVVNWGANPTTSAKLRSASEALKYLAECDESELVEARANGAVAKASERLAPNSKVHIENLIVGGNEEAIRAWLEAEKEFLGESAPAWVDFRFEDEPKWFVRNFPVDGTEGPEIVFTRQTIAREAKRFAEAEAYWRELDPEGMRRIDVGNAELDRRFSEGTGTAVYPSEDEIDAIIRAEEKPKSGMSLRLALALSEDD